MVSNIKTKEETFSVQAFQEMGHHEANNIALTHTALQSFTAHVRNASGENEKCHFFGDRFFGNPHLELGPLVSSGSSSPISANTRSKGSEWGQKIEDRQKYLRHAKCWWHLFRFCSTYLSPMFPVVVCY